MGTDIFQGIKIREVFGIYLLLNLLAVMIFFATPSSSIDFSAVQGVINVLFLVWFAARSKLNREKLSQLFLDFKQKFSWKEMRSLFFIHIGLVFGLVFLSLGIFAAFFPDSMGVVEQTPEYSPSLLANFFLLVLTAPLAEEVLWRGVILNRLVQRMRLVFALFITTFFFALLHYNPMQILSTFLAGILLGVIYLKTKNIFASTFFHVMINSFVFVSMLLLYGDFSEASAVESSSASEDKIMGFVIGLPLTLVCSYFYIRYVKRNWTLVRESVKGQVKNP